MKYAAEFLRCFTVLLFICIAGCEPTTSSQQTTDKSDRSLEVSGKVRWVADGDSFEFESDSGESMTIRLEGIDCPERNQPFADQARDALMAMTKDRRLWVISKGTDKYGRTLANVHDGNVFINGEMLRLGLAWHYAKYNDDVRLAGLQAVAQRDRVGLWQERSPEPPWDYRKRMK